MKRLRWTALIALLAALPSRAQSGNRVYDLLAARRLALATRLADPQLAADEKARVQASFDRFESVLHDPEAFRVEIAIGDIVAAEGAPPKLAMTIWRGNAEYFYPASTVKLCAAVAAFERFNDIARASYVKISAGTPLAFYPLFKDEKLETDDATNVEGGKLTLAHLIRRMLIVSDNDAFNMLYDFCGQKWLNQRMWRAGLRSVRISHRLSFPLTPQQNRKTRSVEFRVPDSPLMLGEQLSDLELDLEGVKGWMVGTSFFDEHDVKIDKPMSFYFKNMFGLGDMQRCLARIVRPDLALDGEPFDLTAEQRAFLMQALSQYPGDSTNPLYPRDKYPDDYAKYFLPGLARVVPKGELAVYNKIGEAYGFLTDNAYVVDTKANQSFFLSATVYANSDGVVNDDKYDYDTFALPFFADLAELVARDEWTAKK
jgi:hypothetical protein